MFSALTDTTMIQAGGTAAFDVTAPVVVLGLVVAAMVAARIAAFLQRPHRPMLRAASEPTPSFRVAA